MSPSRTSAGELVVADETALAGLDDVDLLLALRCGDQAAFGELYLRYAGEARRLAARMVPAEEVDDVISEAFAKVLKAIHGGRGPHDNPVRYIMVAVRTTAFSLRAARSKAPVLDESPGDQILTEDELPGFEDEKLVEAFRTLSQRWRQVIWWAEVEERSPSEIGEMIGLTPSAAAALSYRARRALRDAYRARVLTTPA